MNVKQLDEFIALILKDEQETGVQGKLAALEEALKELASDPQGTEEQVAAKQAYDLFAEGVEGLASRYDFSNTARLEEVGAAPFFTSALLEPIAQAFVTSGMTPAVIHELVTKIRTNRMAYLAQMKEVQAGFGYFKHNGDNEDDPEYGEIGFKIPRTLFRNNLDGLIVELRAIRQIIRAFAELSTRSVPPIEVRQISTSDPLFFFGVVPDTLIAIAGAVTWALKSWKDLEQIRKIRAETAAIPAFSRAEVEKIFDDKIRETIEKTIAEKARELIPDDGKAGRKPELQTALRMALESLLARIERGMTIEIKALPERQKTEAETEAAYAKVAKVAQAQNAKIEELKVSLVFPKPEADPITRLPAPPSGREFDRVSSKGEGGRAKARKRKEISKIAAEKSSSGQS